MRILGISDGMTGGAALLEDGRIVAAIHEERLTRAKMATGFPRQAINKVLEMTGTRPEDVDAIAIATVNEFFRDPAVAYDGWLLREQAPIKELLLNVSSTINKTLGAGPGIRQSYYRLKGLLGATRRRAIQKVLRHEWEFRCPTEFIDHHLAHACSAYFTSGLGDATVITMDGAGDNSCSRVLSIKDGKFQMLTNVDSFDSLGNYYAYATHLCGFKAQKHEGKITGLAAYGQPDYLDILESFIAYEDGKPVNKGGVFYWAAVHALEKALPRSFSKETLAASVQQLLEKHGAAYVKHWVNTTGCGDVALAGGVFANVKFNQRIHELENVDSVFIHPGMGDEGLPVGAAYGMALKRDQNLKPVKLTDVYLGPAYGERELERAIESAGVEAEHVPNMERRVAELLSQGKVVARYDGRMEYGPRALGNRSILYQPTDPSVNDWLNKRLVRTEFMPFAPVTMVEYADQCYEDLDGARYPAHFMTITFDCTPWMKDRCPAVVHVDGTARPQLVDREANPGYYGILEEYHKLTGLPSLINTSFNMHEEPIVCTPGDAIRAFLDGHLDYLAMGKFLLAGPNSG